MQYGNRYSVHISSYGWCFDWGEFKTLEEANECFYNKIRDEVEEQNPDHQRRFYVYMLEWSKDLSYHKKIRCWSVEEGYKIDFPKKPKSIVKILKQLYIKHKVEERRRKEKYVKESIKDIIGCDVCDTYCNSESKKAKVEIDKLKDNLDQERESQCCIETDYYIYKSKAETIIKLLLWDLRNRDWDCTKDMKKAEEFLDEFNKRTN